MENTEAPSDTPHITVYYDGSCPRCRRDRRQFEAMAGDHAQDVIWFDITDQDLTLQKLGIDPRKALTELHVQLEDGRIVSELDAYIVLMARVPRLKWLAWLIGSPGIRPLLAWAYRVSVERRLKREGRW